MNTLKNGTIAEGAPGSEMRRRAENADALKPLNMSVRLFIKTVILTVKSYRRTQAESGYDVALSLRKILALAAKEHGVNLKLKLECS